MPLVETLRLLIAALATATLGWGAFSDIRTRKIPNRSILVLLALFVPWTALHLGPASLSDLEAGGLVFAFSLALYALRVFGAGDAKMLSAAALFLGMGHLPYFLLLTALAGGVLALISLAARPQRALVMFASRGRGDFGPGVPYGAAIALGAAVTLWGMLHGDLPPFPYGSADPLGQLEIARRLRDLLGG